jgi:hypothetical protein
MLGIFLASWLGFITNLYGHKEVMVACLLSNLFLFLLFSFFLIKKSTHDGGGNGQDGRTD